MKHRRLALLAAGAVLLASSSALILAEEGSRDVDFKGSLRVRYHTNSDLDFDKTTNDENDFLLSRVRLSARMPIARRATGVVMLQDSRVFDEELAGTVRAEQRRYDLQEGYLERRELFGVEGLTGTVGRKRLWYGEHRLLGHFDFNNIGRTYDTLGLNLKRGKRWYDFFVAHVVNDPAISQNEALWGLQVGFDLGRSRKLEATVLRRRDPRGNIDLDEYTSGLRSWGPLAGRWDYSAEGHVQRGDRGAADIRAWAWHSGVDYRFHDSRKTKFHLEYNAASGDGDPSDNTIRTFDNLFPTNHYHYGLANRFSWRNMENLRVGVSTHFNGRLWARADYHRFDLRTVRDNWYFAGRAPIGFIGTDPTGTVDSDAGTEVDLLVRYAWRPDLKLELGAAKFMPGDTIRQRGLRADDATLVYLQTVHTF